MIVKQATHSSENAPTGFNVLISNFLIEEGGKNIYETMFSYAACYTAVSQLFGGFNG